MRESCVVLSRPWSLHHHENIHVCNVGDPTLTLAPGCLVSFLYGGFEG